MDPRPATSPLPVPWQRSGAVVSWSGTGTTKRKRKPKRKPKTDRVAPGGPITGRTRLSAPPFVFHVKRSPPGTRLRLAEPFSNGASLARHSATQRRVSRETARTPRHPRAQVAGSSPTPGKGNRNSLNQSRSRKPKHLHNRKGVIPCNSARRTRRRSAHGTPCGTVAPARTLHRAGVTRPGASPAPEVSTRPADAEDHTSRTAQRPVAPTSRKCGPPALSPCSSRT